MTTSRAANDIDDLNDLNNINNINDAFDRFARRCGVAYVRLLRHFGNRMSAVADHLMIAESWAYRCCSRARLWAVCQRPVAASMMQGEFMPGPWRRYHHWRPRPGEQLAFDFDDEPNSTGSAHHSHSIVAGGLDDTS